MFSTLVFSLALLTQAPTGEAALEGAFGNTVVSTYPDGRTAHLWLQRGGRFEGEGRSRRHNSGTWRIKGRELCLRQQRPMPVPLEYCTPIVVARVGGSSWTARAVTGETIQVRVVAGRQGG